MTLLFTEKNSISDIAQNILQKRYLKPNETSWGDVVVRVLNHVHPDLDDDNKVLLQELLLNRYFIPNSPCLANAGTKNAGLSACFVVDFPDNIHGIFKTKLDFALIAKKGGGCGTTLSKLRPENSLVNGSAHGYAGGPIKFFNTICHDMEVMTQAGFREMAMLGVMSVYHPDIMKFITAKNEEGLMHTTNISVMVDDKFMLKVINNDNYGTAFGVSKVYSVLNAREVFNLIVEGAWRNGEPGILFYEKINDNSPYKYSGQEMLAANPCGEQPLPFNGSCNLGSFDVSKFLDDEGFLELPKLEIATRLAVRFLDAVIDVNSFPTEETTQWAAENRAIGIGIMGLADYFLARETEYGSKKSIEDLEFILKFIYEIAEDESIILGEEKGVPIRCQALPHPRRNVTLLSIAPTGTISLLAGCSSGIEPIFSEITTRVDKTGTYYLENPKANLPYFKCAVSSNGKNEVTWLEHILIQNAAQHFVDAGVSKTINFPNHTRRETVYDALIEAWKSPYIKGLTVYRNGSRKTEVLTPKNLKRDLCPVCGNDLIFESGCKKCSNVDCNWSVCIIG